MTALLEIRDLHVAVDGRQILKGLSLTLQGGEVHGFDACGERRQQFR